MDSIIFVPLNTPKNTPDANKIIGIVNAVSACILIALDCAFAPGKLMINANAKPNMNAPYKGILVKQRRPITPRVMIKLTQINLGRFISSKSAWDGPMLSPSSIVLSRRAASPVGLRPAPRRFSTIPM